MKTNFRCVPAALLTLLLGPLSQCLLSQTPPPALVTLAASDFEVDADGWQGTNNLGGPETRTYRSGGATSNSVGYISVGENAGGGGLLYFAAPSKYLGDKRTAYNGVFRFQFKQSATTSLTAANRFVILGSTNGGLSFDLTVMPGTGWQAFEVPLNENVGWHTASSDGLTTSDDRATREYFLAVLGSLDRLSIRAEFSTHNFDQSDLDDVALLRQPSGLLQPALAAAAYAGITIDGAVGVSYRIEYRGAFDAADSWQKLADVVLPFSPYLFIDQSSPSASRRFYRAALNQ